MHYRYGCIVGCGGGSGSDGGEGSVGCKHDDGRQAADSVPYEVRPNEILSTGGYCTTT
eukprot:SAG11_NODE_14742_length_601_cov_0.950199_1_plen_57_part_01